jgi:hypothetical protein
MGLRPDDGAVVHVDRLHAATPTPAAKGTVPAC